MGKVATQYDVSTATSPEALLSIAGLNWEPQVAKASYVDQTSDPDSPLPNADQHRAIINPATGTALAYVSPRFKPNSHIKAVNDVWGLVQHGSISPQNVSVWDGGGRIALQFRAHDLDVRIGSKSVISPLLTLVVNHAKGGADRAFFADFDYWCKNQAGLVAKIQGAGVRHSAGVIRAYESLLEDRIKSLRDGMGDRYAAMRRMAEGRTDIRGKELVSYFARTLDFAPSSVDDTFAESVKAKAENRVEVLSAEGKVLKAIVGDWRADDNGAPGTAWHAYSAVTRYTTHTEGRNPATRMQRSLLGSQDRFVRAFNEARALNP